jgi:hypothetical protein
VTVSEPGTAAISSPTRRRGYSGSIGTNAAPAFNVATNATARSTDGGSSNAT